MVRWGATLATLSAGFLVALPYSFGVEIQPMTRPSLEISEVPDQPGVTAVKFCDGFSCASLLPKNKLGFSPQQWREVGRQCVGYALYGRDHARQQKNSLSTLAFLTGQGWIPIVFGLLVSGGVRLLPEPELDSADASLLLDRLPSLQRSESGVFYMETPQIESLARAIKACAKNVN